MNPAIYPIIPIVCATDQNQDTSKAKKLALFEFASGLEHSGNVQHSANFAKDLDVVLPPERHLTLFDSQTCVLAPNS